VWIIIKKILILTVILFLLNNITYAEILWYNPWRTSCSYYTNSCYNSCIENNSWWPLAYESLCVQKCCLLYKEDVDYIIYFLIFIFFIWGWFLIYKKFRKK